VFKKNPKPNNKNPPPFTYMTDIISNTVMPRGLALRMLSTASTRYKHHPALKKKPNKPKPSIFEVKYSCYYIVAGFNIFRKQSIFHN